MYSIESANLARTIWVISNAGERGELLKRGVPESDIYTGTEIKAMRGISLEGLKAIQTAKDLFPGSSFESFGKSEPIDRAEPGQAPEPPPEPSRGSGSTQQLSLLD